MKNNKKRGFTLVELLVVIAILAILATVAVVGYTSFITRARVSNDEEVANQMNDFWTALRADSMGDYYGEDITQDNVWHITQTILEKSGVGNYAPESRRDGYHIYFKFNENGIGGEYVVAKENEVLSPAMRLFQWLRALAGNVDYSEAPYMPGVFVNGNQMYFLADTHGSDLADAVRDFYTVESEDEVKALYDFLYEVVEENDIPSTYLAALKEAYTKTVFITSDGFGYADRSGSRDMLIVSTSATTLKSRIYLTVNGVANGYIDVDTSKPLISANRDMIVILPNTITGLGANSLTINKVSDEDEVRVVIYGGSWGDIQFGEGFVNGDITVDIGGDKVEVEDGVVDGSTGGVVIETVTFPLYDFNLYIVDEANKVVNREDIKNKGYVALDIAGGFSFNVIDVNIESGKEAPKPDVNYKVVSLVVNGASVEANDFEKYVKVSGNTITFIKDANGILPKVDKIGIEATANQPYEVDEETEVGEYASATYEVSVVRINTATLTLQDTTLGSLNKINTAVAYRAPVLNDKNEVITEYNNTYSGAFATERVAETVQNKVTYVNPIAGITLDETITFSYNGTGLTLSEDNKSMTLTGAGTGTLKIKVGELVEYTTALTVYDKSTFPLQAKTNITHLGSDGTNNVIMLSDLFTGTAPSGAEIWIGEEPYSDTNYMSAAERAFVIDATRKDSDDTFYAQSAIVDATGSISFVGESGSTNLVNIAVYLDGVRISDDIAVEVVSGKNVRSFAELDKTGSNVILADIKIPDNPTLKVNDRIKFTDAGTIYGNHHKFDITNGTNVMTGNGDQGIITLLNTNMQDLKVVGALYSIATMPAYEAWGANAVHAKGEVTITNCYIANCRAPLATGYENDTIDDNVTVNNCVIFGGRYTNIELRGGILTFEGKVITINQPHTNQLNADSVDINDKIAGLGVSVWFEAPTGTKINNANKLVQYNFIPKTYTEMPVIKISFSGVTVEVDTGETLNKVYNDMSGIIDRYYTYKDYWFVTEDNTYINPGIIGEDLGDATTWIAEKVGVTIDSGDRTGLSGAIPTNCIKGELSQRVTLNYNGLKVPYVIKMHLYGVKNTNTSLLTASANAEYIYSPWSNKIATGEDENGNIIYTTYYEYGFNESNNIIHN